MKNQSNSREENLREISDTAQQNGGVAEKILNVLPIGVSMTDQNGKFTYVNPRFCEMFGYSREEILDDNFSKIAMVEPKERLNLVHEVLNKYDKETQGEWEVQRKGGEKFQVLINASVVEDDNSGEDRRMVFMVELSDPEYSSVKINTAMEMLNKKLDAQELAYYISNHDMRNNLASIAQLSDLLLDSYLDKKQLKWVELIHQLSDRTLKLLKMSSDYLKMENGQYEREMSQFDLLSLLKDQADAYEQRLMRQNINLITLINGQETDYREENLMVEADHLYVERMFNNLLINAIEASPEGEEVKVDVCPGENLLVTIQNRGMIPEDVQVHFFDKFATSGKEDGTGLGTYIAKLVTELHGGTIKFESNKVDGTTILVDLPGSMISKK